MAVILFDFDLTLADASPGIIESIHYALSREGLPLPEKHVILATIGLSLPETFQLLAPGFSSDILIQHFKERADQVMTNSTTLFPDVPHTIKSLRTQGHRLGIVSTKYRFRIEAVLERDGLLNSFELIIGGEDVSRHKPDPEGILLALTRFCATKAETYLVGDSVVDGKTAEAAGVKFVGVVTGVTSKADLELYRSVYVLNSIVDLLSLSLDEPEKIEAG